MTLHGIDDLPPRLRRKVVVRGECWEWVGARQPEGHGNYWTGERFDKPYRATYRLAYGEIPDDYIIHHRCENPPCVRPEHLRAITRKEHADEHGLSGAALVHAEAVTCKNGHPFDGYDGRQRTCSECRRKTSREWARRKRDQERQLLAGKSR